MRWVAVDVDVGHPDFGKWKQCPECKPWVDRRNRRRFFEIMSDRIRKYSQMVGRYHAQTFEAFDLRGRSKSIRTMYTTCRKYASAPDGWLVLWGPCGTGKTHMASAICHTIKSDDSPVRPLVLYMTAPDMLDFLRSGYSEDDYQKVIDLCRRVDVLVVDDLGTEAVKDWTYEKLFQILNGRYQDEGATVIISNVNPNEFDFRISSRMQDKRLASVLHVVGEDYRGER
jgi:DNA replication protein DnaC